MIIYRKYVTLHYLIKLSHTQDTFIYCFLTPTSNMQREREREREREIDRQTDRPTDRQTDRQTDREKDRHTDTQTEK